MKEEFINKYKCDLKESTGSEYMTNCIFHEDDTPSLSVNFSKDVYFCHSCSMGGSVSSLLGKKSEPLHQEIIDLNADVSQYSIDTCAKKYLESRQITDESIKKFNIGSSAMTIFFPISDISGNTISVSKHGYKMKPGDVSYYRHSPNTEIYKKSNNFYGMSQAIKNIYKTNTVSLCEGFFDVISLHQSGVTNALACLGTSLPDTSQLPKNVNFNIYPDSDKAGMKALRTITLQILEKFPNSKIRFYKGEGDPDDDIKNGFSRGYMCGVTYSFINDYLSITDGGKHHLIDIHIDNLIESYCKIPSKLAIFKVTMIEAIKNHLIHGFKFIYPTVPNLFIEENDLIRRDCGSMGIPGFEKYRFIGGTLMVLGGATESGKTTTIVKMMAENNNERNQLYLSLEMSKYEIAEAVSVHGITPENNRIHFNDDSSNIADIVRVFDRSIRENPEIEIVYIDHFHALDTDNMRDNTTSAEEKNIKKLLGMAKKHNIFLVVVTQLVKYNSVSAQSKTFEFKNPSITDIKGAGLITQSANFVMIVDNLSRQLRSIGGNTEELQDAIETASYNKTVVFTVVKQRNRDQVVPQIELQFSQISGEKTIDNSAI